MYLFIRIQVENIESWKIEKKTTTEEHQFFDYDLCFSNFEIALFNVRNTDWNKFKYVYYW